MAYDFLTTAACTATIASFLLEVWREWKKNQTKKRKDGKGKRNKKGQH